MAEPNQPEPTEAQRIEAGLLFWRKAASDTAVIVKLYQEAGFSREEAVRFTILAITGKDVK
jgi:hypothetical protein